MEMFGGVFILGRITAANVAAASAKTQVDPGVAHSQALLATSGFRFDVVHLIEMRALSAHGKHPPDRLGPAALARGRAPLGPTFPGPKAARL